MLCVSHCRLLATNLTTTTVVLLGLLFVYSWILFLFRQDKIVVVQIYVSKGN